MIKIRRGSETSLTSLTELIPDGQLVVGEVDSTTIRLRVGNGSSRYSALPYITLNTSGVVPISQGGTGATTVAQAQENLGVAISEETIQMFADAGYPIT